MINKLIIYLTALRGVAKDVHYTSKNYGDHLLADRIAEPLDGFVDDLKEVCLLGRGEQVKKSGYYYEISSKIAPEASYWQGVIDIIKETLRVCESLERLTRGEENLIGSIAQHLQTMYGLLIMINAG